MLPAGGYMSRDFEWMEWMAVKPSPSHSFSDQRKSEILRKHPARRKTEEGRRVTVIFKIIWGIW
jgi:hypothetical protein